MIWQSRTLLCPSFIQCIDFLHVLVRELTLFLEVGTDAFPLGGSWDDHLSLGVRPGNDCAPRGAIVPFGNPTDHGTLQYRVGFGSSQDPLDAEGAVCHELDPFTCTEVLQFHVVTHWIRVSLQNNGADLGKAKEFHHLMR